MEHFVTDFQEFKANTAERIDKIVRLLRGNVMWNDTIQTDYIKQQVGLLQNENNRLRMESESLLKVIELLSVQQINTHEANDNTENSITVKGTVKIRKSNWTINSILEFHRGIHLKFFPLKNARTNWNLMMRKSQRYLHLIVHLLKEDRKSSQLNTTKNQGLTLLTTNMKNPFCRRKHVKCRVGEHMWKQPSLERKFVTSVIAT